MILREFLYVDTDKVRGMLAQLDGGVLEEERETTRDDKRTQGGVGRFAQHYSAWGSERLVQKSLGDALFPTLEAALESEGVLQDISESLTEREYWTPDRLQADVPPGTVVRITAQGSLFDARYVASIFAGFATTYQGLQGLGTVPSASSTTPRGKKPQQQPKQQAKPDMQPQLEDSIPELGASAAEEGIGTDQLRAMIRVSRGIFTPGLHLNLSPTNNDEFIVGARLQEGRQFLDSDTDILFARYGIGQQEWTLVGTIGHYAQDVNDGSNDAASFASGDESVNRARMASFVNRFMGQLGSQGFIDLPQLPGFSVVPLAVYRVIPGSTLNDASLVTRLARRMPEESDPS